MVCKYLRKNKLGEFICSLEPKTGKVLTIDCVRCDKATKEFEDNWDKNLEE